MAHPNIISRSGFVISAFEGTGTERVSTRTYSASQADEICQYLQSLGCEASWAKDDTNPEQAWIYAYTEAS